MDREIFTSSWFVWVCILLFWFCLFQNFIFDYPYRFKDIFGGWFLTLIVGMHFWGMFVGSTKDEGTSTKNLIWVNIPCLIVFVVISVIWKSI